MSWNPLMTATALAWHLVGSCGSFHRHLATGGWPNPPPQWVVPCEMSGFRISDGPSRKHREDDDTSEPNPGIECKGGIAAPLPLLHTDRFVASHPCWQAADHNCHKFIHWQGGLCSRRVLCECVCVLHKVLHVHSLTFVINMRIHCECP